MPRTAKTGRLTWANRFIAYPQSLAATGRQFFDLLASAESFQKFDSTIVHVIGALSFTYIQVAAGSSSEDCIVGAYLYVADDNLQLTNFPDLTAEATQPSYLWTHYHAARILRTTETAGDQADNSLNWYAPLDVKAMRKFRENNKTLWLVIDNISTTHSLLFGGLIRTLVRIP